MIVSHLHHQVDCTTRFLRPLFVPLVPFRLDSRLHLKQSRDILINLDKSIS